MLKNWWHKFLCAIGDHDLRRTQHACERRCARCGGSYFGRVVYYRDHRGLGEWEWYSAEEIARIKRDGHYVDLVNGTGRFAK